MNLGKNIKLQIGLTYASGTATRNGNEVDMQGYDGVIAVLTNATIAAAATGDIHWEQDTATGMGGAQDLASSAIALATANSDQIIATELYRPLERFVRIVVTKDGANAQAESVLYILYKGDKMPISNIGASTYELNIGPAEGSK